MKSVAVMGASGFIGSEVCRALERRGLQAVGTAAPRIMAVSAATGLSPRLDDRLIGLMKTLQDQLRDVDVVINAAGIANPGQSSTSALDGANGILPRLVAMAARAARVGRFVHISSAATQGRLPLLDQSQRYDPFSKYARSKILGERAILALQWPNAVIYRPTSVHGMERQQTKSLARLSRSPLSSYAGDGSRPSPQVLAENVGDAVSFIVQHERRVPSVVLHPNEGMTTRGVQTLLGAGNEPRRVPEPIAKAIVASSIQAGRPSSRLLATARRLEMLWFGQAQAESWLDEAGWRPPAGDSEWRALGNKLACQEVH